ncbi:hypothetical protein BJ742DRAFT_737252 [Cladochytrium replicatum]|nr:hypothetical protein BJ742DRAFT_737252 [Cladochytrium replicatum]
MTTAGNKLFSGAPPARGGPSLAAFGESLYVYGGLGGVNERGDVFKYDLKSVRFCGCRGAGRNRGSVRCEKYPSPTGHIGSGNHLDDSYLLLIKDVEKPILVSVETLDKENCPTPRGWIAAAAEGKKGVVPGGLDGAKSDDGLFVIPF